MEHDRTAFDNGEIGLVQALQALWVKRRLIATIVIVCTLAAYVYAMLATEWFQADVVLVQTSNKAAQSSFGQLGGLASLAGINLGGAGNTQEPIAVLKSRDFARDFISDQQLLPILFVEKWNAEKGRWRDSDPMRQPDLRDAVKYFDEKVRAVNEDKRTGLVTISITWKDAALGAQWANLLAQRLNKRMRNQALVESERNIKYLRDELTATNVPALQQSIGKVLESEMQKLLIARGSEDYSFKVIDSAVPAKKRARPQRVLIVSAAFAISALLASLGVLARLVFLGDRYLRAPDNA